MSQILAKDFLFFFYLKTGEVLWQYGFHNEKYYVSSYAGEHYSINLGNVDLFFNTSTDGVTWEPVDENIPVTYHGGISEVG